MSTELKLEVTVAFQVPDLEFSGLELRAGAISTIVMEPG